jgi:hypothetical protein
VSGTGRGIKVINEEFEETQDAKENLVLDGLQLYNKT